MVVRRVLFAALSLCARAFGGSRDAQKGGAGLFGCVSTSVCVREAGAGVCGSSPGPSGGSTDLRERERRKRDPSSPNKESFRVRPTKLIATPTPSQRPSEHARALSLGGKAFTGPTLLQQTSGRVSHQGQRPPPPIISSPSPGRTTRARGATTKHRDPRAPRRAAPRRRAPVGVVDLPRWRARRSL